MRLELHLFLWVTAGLAVLLQLSGGIRLPEKLTFDQSLVRAQLAVDDTDNSRTDLVPGRITARTGMVGYDRSIRSMFNTRLVTFQDSQPEFAIGLQVIPPVLKGVLGGDEGRRAVFARGPSGADYIAVGVGETVSDYRIVAIGQDFVTAVSPAGEEVTLELRGAGEGN